MADWLDGCRAGVVVFSMGSMVKASTLDNHVRDQMVGIFGRLKQCVLWKWEQQMPNLPENVKTVAWLPQSHVLGKKGIN